MIRKLLMAILLVFSLMVLTACDVAEELIQQITSIFNEGTEDDANANADEQEEVIAEGEADEPDFEETDEEVEGYRVDEGAESELETEQGLGEQGSYPPMTVAERIAVENLEVYDTPNGLPPIIPTDWFLVEDADYANDSGPLTFKYCFDSDMSENINIFKQTLEESGVGELGYTTNDSPKMNIKAEFDFILDPEMVPVKASAIFYIDEFGSFVGNNCFDLIYGLE